MNSYISEIQAIDIHGHYGSLTRGKSKLCDEWMAAGIREVIQRAQLSNIKITVISPLGAFCLQGNADVVKANLETYSEVSKNQELLQWVVVTPSQPNTYVQASELLESRKCAGIKIHPEEHKYGIVERGWELFSFAAKHKAIVLTHSGEQNSMPEDMVKFANDFPEITLILGHLGCGWDGDPSHQVRAIQQSKHGNIFVDTSSATSILPGLIEWGVSEVGADKILFGTDSPLYFTPSQRARIDNAEISDNDKRLILSENAEKILGIKCLGPNLA